MEDQLVKPEKIIQNLLVTVLSIALVVAIGFLGVYQFRHANPYVRAVLALPGDQVQGHAIFQMNCAGCHGLQADGHVGPSLLGVSERKSRYALIHQVTSGATPPMPQFQPSPKEMADLLSYLESL